MQQALGSTWPMSAIPAEVHLKTKWPLAGILAATVAFSYFAFDMRAADARIETTITILEKRITRLEGRDEARSQQSETTNIRLARIEANLEALVKAIDRQGTRKSY